MLLQPKAKPAGSQPLSWTDLAHGRCVRPSLHGAKSDFTSRSILCLRPTRYMSRGFDNEIGFIVRVRPSSQIALMMIPVSFYHQPSLRKNTVFKHHIQILLRRSGSKLRVFQVIPMACSSISYPSMHTFTFSSSIHSVSSFSDGSCAHRWKDTICWTTSLSR